MCEIKVKLVKIFRWYNHNNFKTNFGSLTRDESLVYPPAKDMELKLPNNERFFIEHIKQNVNYGHLTLYTWHNIYENFESDAKSIFIKEKKKMLKEGWIEE